MQNLIPTPKGSNYSTPPASEEFFLALRLHRFHLRLLTFLPFGENKRLPLDCRCERPNLDGLGHGPPLQRSTRGQSLELRQSEAESYLTARSDSRRFQHWG